jgi:hypothetical protein
MAGTLVMNYFTLQMKNRSTESFPLEAYLKLIDIDCGKIVVKELQFLAMEGREEGKYYNVLDCTRLSL